MSELKPRLTIDIANFKGERGFHGLLCFYIHVRAHFLKVCGPREYSNFVPNCSKNELVNNIAVTWVKGSH